jgi:hypothetical protein
MATLDSAKKRLDEARQQAQKRATRERIGPDWPRADGIELTDALDDLCVEMLAEGARLSFGVTDGTSDVWARLAYPLECNSEHRGMVCFMTGGTLENVLRKVAQAIPVGPETRMHWKEDRYAR